jgi:hypothetical protein
MDTPSGYRIAFKVNRVLRHPSNVLDPCPDFDFSPPRDSEELFEALRTAYPRGRTHRGRMMEAVIEFVRVAGGIMMINTLLKLWSSQTIHSQFFFFFSYQPSSWPEYVSDLKRELGWE